MKHIETNQIKAHFTSTTVYLLPCISAALDYIITLCQHSHWKWPSLKLSRWSSISDALTSTSSTPSASSSSLKVDLTAVHDIYSPHAQQPLASNSHIRSLQIMSLQVVKNSGPGPSFLAGRLLTMVTIHKKCQATSLPCLWGSPTWLPQQKLYNLKNISFFFMQAGRPLQLCKYHKTCHFEGPKRHITES